MFQPTTMTAEERILRQRTKIMQEDRCLGVASVLMIGEWRVVSDIPTAATNGRDVMFGRAFVDSIDDATLRFVILHEYFHLMFMHMTMWKHLFDEDAQTANTATDIIINNLLDETLVQGGDAFITIWPHAALDHQYDGMDTGEVYRRLKQQGAANKPNPGNGQPGQGKPGPGQPGAGKGSGAPVRSASGGQAQEFDEHDTSGGPAKMSDDEVKQLHAQIDTAIRQGAIMAGKVAGSANRMLDSLMEVSVDWQEVLQDFVKTHASGNDLSTWRRLSRRWMSKGIKMPSRYTEAAKRITIGVDTSGSIGDTQLQRALSEIKGACDTVRPECVDVIYWDYQVAGHETYEADAVEQLTQVTKPKGGGGTRVRSMLDYMNSRDIKPDCIIIFTDGYVEHDWGGDGWSAPVLWCVSTKGIVAPSGKTLYVPI